MSGSAVAAGSWSQRSGRALLLAAIALQAALALAYGVPGHLSVDSMVQLYEGRTHHFISFHPPMLSLLLGVFDRIVPGTALFVLLNQALYTVSLLLLAARARPIGIVRALLAAIVVFNPLILVYTGIVWKDVLFAHLALFGYAALATAAHAPTRTARIGWLIGCWLAVALAASLRQQGILVAIPAAFVGAWMMASRRGARLGLAAAALLGVVAVNALILAIAHRVAVAPEEARAAVGVRALVYYDLAGIVANGGALAQPEAQREVERIAPKYDESRIDTLPYPAADSWFGRAPAREWLRLWRKSVTRSPAAYLAHRTRHFGALMGFGDHTRCLPIHVGVIPTAFVHPALQRDIVAELRVTGGADARALRIQSLMAPLFDGPLFSHAAWALIVVIAGALLLRQRGERSLVWLGAASLALAASYFFVSIACDFRYVYLLPVTATAMLLVRVVGGRDS